MCGIIGGTNKHWDFASAVNSLMHRGPDSQKFVHNDDLSLAFTRLAIIDLNERANQPMCTADKTVWIVFNGEIYDFIALREHLTSKNHFFRTQSDTEVILNAYLEWGDQFVDHIDGMFAIAIHDVRHKELKLFRDRVGIKPLYFYDNGKDFAFASELKAIERLCRDAQFQYDYTALYDYLTYMYIPEPKTLYKNVYKLLPAHKLIFDLKENRIVQNSPYWKLDADPAPKPLPIAAACDQLRHLINKSVKDQLVADVPVGFFLSGGMDSSTIVTEAASISDKIETYSIGFDDDHHTEIHYAQEVANFCSTKHSCEILTDQHTRELFDQLKIWFDEPFADTSAFPTYLVSKFAKKNVTVALTGDGGDEIFGGYHLYNAIPAIDRYPFNKYLHLNKLVHHTKSFFPFRSLAYKIINQLDLLTSDELAAHAKLIGGMTTLDKKSYAEAWQIPKGYDSYWHFRKYNRKDLPIRTRLQYIDFHTYLPNDILTKVDRTSMSVSLEARVPLLSKDIIEFCFSIPENLRYLRNQQKGLLKEAYSGKLPSKILKRSKQGFSIPAGYLDQRTYRKQVRILSDLFGIKS